MWSYSSFKEEIDSCKAIRVELAPKSYRRRYLDETGVRLYKCTKEFGLSLATGIKGTHYFHPVLIDPVQLMAVASSVLEQNIGFSQYAKKHTDDAAAPSTGTEQHRISGVR